MLSHLKVAPSRTAAGRTLTPHPGDSHARPSTTGRGLRQHQRREPGKGRRAPTGRDVLQQRHPGNRWRPSPGWKFCEDSGCDASGGIPGFDSLVSTCFDPGPTTTKCLRMFKAIQDHQCPQVGWKIENGRESKMALETRLFSSRISG